MLSDFPLPAHRRPHHYVLAKVDREVSKYLHGRSSRRPIKSKYLLLDEIGSGACGSVHLAADIETSLPCAIKIRGDTKDNRKFGPEPFRLETETMGRLSHPAICKFFDSGTMDNAPFFVMSLVSGPNLHQYMLGGYRSLRTSLSIVSDLCHVLDYVHSQGVVHRDVKPKNVMIDMSTDTPTVFLIDFGLVKVRGQRDPFLNFSENIGNPIYQPSRSELVSASCDLRVDIYSLGMLLYDLMVSHNLLSKVIGAARLASLPFSDVVLRRDATSGIIPQGVVPIISCATSPDPTRRFQTAKAMQDAIEDILVGLGKVD